MEFNHSKFNKDDVALSISIGDETTNGLALRIVLAPLATITLLTGREDAYERFNTSYLDTCVRLTWKNWLIGIFNYYRVVSNMFWNVMCHKLPFIISRRCADFSWSVKSNHTCSFDRRSEGKVAGDLVFRYESKSFLNCSGWIMRGTFVIILGGWAISVNISTYRTKNNDRERGFIWRRISSVIPQNINPVSSLKSHHYFMTGMWRYGKKWGKKNHKLSPCKIIFFYLVPDCWNSLVEMINDVECLWNNCFQPHE